MGRIAPRAAPAGEEQMAGEGGEGAGVDEMVELARLPAAVNGALPDVGAVGPFEPVRGEHERDDAGLVGGRDDVVTGAIGGDHVDRTMSAVPRRVREP